jgi:fusaric acid resistance family protein
MGETGTAENAAKVKLQYAVKTALSLTLAYLIPMSQGWPQPQTAATTVMLIAATGMVSESLQKGVSRVLGTVIGAILGLSLIILFPQERMAYLLAASCIVAVVIYLYNAYQGDSTVFMLTAVVTLMVFNGGDAEGAFLYGADRAFMTAFGVLVYTVVASMLWPVKSADNTRSLAAALAGHYRDAFMRLTHPNEQNQPGLDDFLAALVTDGQTFQTQFASVKNHADGVTDYLREWNTVVGTYEELESILLPALKQVSGSSVHFSDYIDDYQPVLSHIEALFGAVDAAWRGQRTARPTQALAIELNVNALRGAGHLVVAAVAARRELLQRLQHVLLDLLVALDSLLFDQGSVTNPRVPRGKPVFNWLDLENLKTAVRAFVTFWIATAIWIYFNPPGGFMFVTLCTILVPLVSFTPVTPKLLFILLTLGFVFALPAYVFLLPQLTHWLELAAFLFAYAFVGFYVFQGPVSIFFLLGLFTLGIQNTMSYHVDAILLSILMFYMVCATLIITMYFPFSSKPERLYLSLRRRFFRLCARWLRMNARSRPMASIVPRIFISSGSAMLAKMEAWGPKIDTSLFAGDGGQQVAALNNSCEVLYAQLQVLALRQREFSGNSLIAAAREKNTGSTLAAICDLLADQGAAADVAKLESNVTNIEKRLDELLGDDYLDRYDPHELAQFYVYLNLLASIFLCLAACRQAHEAVDWRRMGETRF